MHSSISSIVLAFLVLIFVKKAISDVNLNLRLENFENKFGLTSDGQPCAPQHKCLTFFKFCLKISAKSCLAEFRTDSLGENSIRREQFKMTTDSIEFLITQKYLTSSSQPITLLVQAYHKSSDIQQEDMLINEWTLAIKIQHSVDNDHYHHSVFANLNKWNKFESTSTLNSIQFSYQLKCSKNFYGPRCDQSPTELTHHHHHQAECDLKCKNGAVCILSEITRQPMCKCSSAGYEGDLCQIRVVRECSSNDVCLNGGSCVANGECLCAPGYAGDKCQTKRTPSQCGPVTCFNGGTCTIDNQNEYACVCHPLFGGAYCETKKDVSSTSRPSSIGIDFSTPSAITQANQHDSLSAKQICLIVLLGVGMPVLVILLAVLGCRVRSRSSRKACNDEENFKKIDFDTEKQTIYHQDEAIKQKSFVSNNFIQNNLFDAQKEELNEKQIFINTISGSISTKNETKQQQQNQNSLFNYSSSESSLGREYLEKTNSFQESIKYMGSFV